MVLRSISVGITWIPARIVIRRPAMRITARPKPPSTAVLSLRLRKPTEGPRTIIATATIKRMSRTLRRSISSSVCFAMAIVTILFFLLCDQLRNTNLASRLADGIHEHVFQGLAMWNNGSYLAICAANQFQDVRHFGRIGGGYSEASILLLNIRNNAFQLID